MTDPCSLTDFPTPYTPTNGQQSQEQCVALGPNYHYGVLQPPIDALNRGPYLLRLDYTDQTPGSTAQCYFNSQPQGSIVYQRFRDFFGPL